MGELNSGSLLGFVAQYGPAVLYLLVFVEYLNVPGTVGGVALPAVGAFVKLGSVSFWGALLWSFVAAQLGMVIVYALCCLFHAPLKRFINARPKYAKSYGRVTAMLDKYGAPGLAVTRLIPVIRTFSSIPAGFLAYPFWRYFFLSTPGTVIYILGNLLIGYYFTGVFL